MIRLFKKNKIKIKDLVRIKDDKETPKVVYEVYDVIKTSKGSVYIIQNTYSDKLHNKSFKEEELIKL